uniref:Diacylglycerol acyltransferase n=1 Tax=Bodo saltans TaxID=75058 RepID=B6DTB3_BODSA|nr:diacylglycerol acyltransferase [Bodo saltans]
MLGWDVPLINAVLIYAGNVDSIALSKALSIISVILGVLALCASLHADLFFCDDRSLAFAGLIGSLFCTIAGGACAYFVGQALLRAEGFKFWQPFQGGLSFVILQYFGWLFFGVSVTMYTVFAASFELIFSEGCRSGTVTSVGCLAFASILTLLASVPRYDGAASPLFANLKLIKTDNLVVVACLTASMVFSFLLEFRARLLQPYRMGLSMSLFTINIIALVLVVFLGRRRFDGQKIFHPFHGGFYFVLMQSSGWAGVAVAIFFFLRFAIDTMLPGMLVGVTFLQVSSTWLLLLSLDCFENAESVDALLRFRLSREIVALLIIGVVALGTITICDLASVHHSFLYHFALLCQACVAPLVHIYASANIRGFNLWQPFLGGPRFILLSGIAWSVYALAHMILILALWNRIYAVVAAASLFVLVTDVLVCASLHVFDELEAGNALRQARRAAVRRHSPYLNGELVTSALMSIGGALTLGVIDYSTQVIFRKAHIGIFGVVAMLIGPPLAQASGRWVYPNSFRVMRPFYGGSDHVALQTVGWSLWGAMVVVFAILEVNLLIAEDSVAHGAATTAAAAALFSYCLIVASLPLFRPDESTTATTPPRDNDRVQVENNNGARRGIGDNDERTEGIREAQELLRTGVIVSPALRRALLTYIATSANTDDDNEPHPTPPIEPRAHQRRTMQSIDSESPSLSPRMAPTSVPRSGEGMGFLAVTLSSGSLVLGPICELLNGMMQDPMRTAAVGPTMLAMSLAAVSGCLITHLVCGRHRYPHHYTWWMPFGGGSNFALLQTLGWAMVSVHLSLILSSLYSLVALGNLSLFAGVFFAAGFFGFAGHMFLVVSLSQFDVNAEAMPAHEKSFLHRNSEWFLGSILTVLFVASLSMVEMRWKQSQQLSVATVPLICIGGFSFLAAIGLGWASVWKSRRLGATGELSWDRAPITPLMAVPHHRAQHAFLPDPSRRQQRRAYQVTMLSETVVGTLFLLWVLKQLFAFSANRWLLGIAMAAITHHAIMLLTIVWHEHRSLTVVGRELAAELATFSMYSFHYVVMFVLVYTSFYAHLSTPSVLFFVGMNVLSLGSDTIVRFVQVGAIVCMLSDVISWTLECTWFMLPLLAYSSSYYGTSQVDGRRRLMALLQHPWLERFCDAIAKYFSLRVVSEFNPTQPKLHVVSRPSVQFAHTPTPESRKRAKVVYGFHPHGVCPYTCLWASMGSAWVRAGLPRATVHVSSFLMSVPVVRDVLLSIGAVDCTFDALRVSHGSPDVQAMMIVPGGLRECNQPLPSSEGFTLVTKNKGLFRFVLQNGGTLVPVFCFGETDIMGNAPLPIMQFWAKSRLGITYPQLPHGRLLLPIPRRLPIYIAVGEGIVVDAILDPRPVDVEALHKEYYAALRALFEKHKVAAGYPDSVLTLV